MATALGKEKMRWRLIVVGGHTRSIGKTQLVCDVIRAFPETEWIAGKITQYGHGVCARNGENCDCAPTEHVCALDWETQSDTGTDTARFLEAGAKRSFWLRTKQGYLAEGLPLLRQALEEVASDEWRVASEATQVPTEELRSLGAGGFQPPRKLYEMSRASAPEASSPAASEPTTHKTAELFRPPDNLAVIVESNSLMQFLKPSLYFAVIDPLKEDFKESAQLALDRAHALVMRAELTPDAPPAPLWMKLPEQLMREKPSVLQREGEKLPEPLWELVHRILEGEPGAAV